MRRVTQQVKRLIAASSGAFLALGVVTVVAAPGAVAVPAPVEAGVQAPQAVADVSDVAAAWEKSPVYVDPAARDQLSQDQQDALAEKIKDADKAVFVAVLPAGFEQDRQDRLFEDLRADTGVTGLYGVRLGDEFNARADSQVMSSSAVGNLVERVQGESTADQLNTFVDNAVRNMGGAAPASWGGGADDGVPVGGLIGLGVAAAVVGGGAYTVVRRNKRRKEEEQREALEKLRVVVDEDITAFGEELERLDFHPAETGATDAMRADYERSLDSYEKAKTFMDRAERPEEVRAVTQSLDDGRYSLAVLQARREGGEPPDRRAPCFFDPRHGPSVEDVTWAPQGSASREVPVCAADRQRLADGDDPDIRTVETATGRRPYWEAGPAYGPWAGGYFAGGMLPGLLMGTMLGSMMASPAYASDYGSGYGDFGGSGYEGGDMSGADYNSGDFGGGFGDGGGGGGFGDGGGFGGGGDFGGGF